MLCEAVVIYNLLVKVFGANKRMWIYIYSGLGWGECREVDPTDTSLCVLDAAGHVTLCLRVLLWSWESWRSVYWCSVTSCLCLRIWRSGFVPSPSPPPPLPSPKVFPFQSSLCPWGPGGPTTLLGSPPTAPVHSTTRSERERHSDSGYGQGTISVIDTVLHGFSCPTSSSSSPPSPSPPPPFPPSPPSPLLPLPHLSLLPLPLPLSLSLTSLSSPSISSAVAGCPLKLE